MRRVALITAFFGCVAFATACTQSSSFSGDSVTGESNPLVADAGAADGDQGASEPDPGAEGADAAVCVPTNAAVNFMILLDVSGSMQPSYVFVFRAINSLVASLQGIVPEGSTQRLSDVKVGIVVFTDVADQQFAVLPLTADVNALKTQLAPFEARIGGGGDGPEQGLYAFTQAMDHMEMMAKGQPVVPVVMMISDNYAHNDSTIQPNHDYSMAPLKQRFGKKPFDSIFIFDFTPGVSPEDLRLPWASPAAQWSAIRDAWKEVNPSIKRTPGKGFGFSFPRTTGVTTSSPITDEERKFETEIVAEITKSLSDALKSCTP